VEQYHDLMDYLNDVTDWKSVTVGCTVFLSSSFQGSTCNMAKKYDAKGIVGRFGKL
jgi:hypothetical protein